MADKSLKAPINQETNPDSESDDEEVVETSPYGRWEKHRKEVSQRNVPGIDCSYLAMDTEEGVEVVWNEVLFSETRKEKYQWKNKESTFKKIFENLTMLDHPNIVKFHKYWMDSKDDQPRLIFITEFMTSGSLRQFLKKTKSNYKTLNLKAWKRWCKQILSALSYLHGCDPPIVHGNLSCDTIFIQHNGLMKIGTVAPESIHRHVKTYKQEAKNMHFVAPEYDMAALQTISVRALVPNLLRILEMDRHCTRLYHRLSMTFDTHELYKCLVELVKLDQDWVPRFQSNSPFIYASLFLMVKKLLIDMDRLFSGLPGTLVNCAADIYSFGMVALELAALVVEKVDGSIVTPESIEGSLDKIEDPRQKDFIRQCLRKEPRDRPTVKELLLHPVLLEVYSLKALAGHFMVNENLNHPDSLDEVDPEKVMAEINYANGEKVSWKYSKAQPLELEKFIEEIRIGLYPLTGMQRSKNKKESQPLLNRIRAEVPVEVDVGSVPSPEPEEETRSITNMQCNIVDNEDSKTKQLTLTLKFEDRMNRQLSCSVQFGEKSAELAEELVRYGFIRGADREQVSKLIDDHLRW